MAAAVAVASARNRLPGSAGSAPQISGEDAIALTGLALGCAIAGLCLPALLAARSNPKRALEPPHGAARLKELWAAYVAAVEACLDVSQSRQQRPALGDDDGSGRRVEGSGGGPEENWQEILASYP
ncbi:hypothetical protein PLESTB_000704800 [Pleodorina starrii]|uniref:Uncharacterized protein n=1 Tax=Pleodorina starrii TaxID=330485 RepID=A0A9W6EWQ1_9CHLO|nr:hypothetical protein PLESTB_000049400 [Pleodorina starrii]GLC53072.1 hypothetical protein PLESTB_000704800 [Pleodorina starrii]GLC69228.1 hypothetical protein PLESTF_000804700 [Pleodorina starrii]